MNNEEKMIALFQNEEFKKNANNCKTAEELQSLFAQNGVEMTVEEVIELCGKIATHMKNGDDELLEENLEVVTGGFAITASVIALGCVCIGAAALGIWNGYHSAKRGK